MHLQSFVTLAKSTTVALHETNTRRSICSDWLIRILIHSSRRTLRSSDSMFTAPRMAAQRDKIVTADEQTTPASTTNKPRTNHALRQPKAAPHWLIQRRFQSKHKRTFKPRTCTKRVRSAQCPNNNNDNNNSGAPRAREALARSTITKIVESSPAWTVGVQESRDFSAGNRMAQRRAIISRNWFLGFWKRNFKAT